MKNGCFGVRFCWKNGCFGVRFWRGCLSLPLGQNVSIVEGFVELFVQQEEGDVVLEVDRIHVEHVLLGHDIS